MALGQGQFYCTTPVMERGWHTPLSDSKGRARGEEDKAVATQQLIKSSWGLAEFEKNCHPASGPDSRSSKHLGLFPASNQNAGYLVGEPRRRKTDSQSSAR